jgi:hypothetical protein
MLTSTTSSCSRVAEWMNSTQVASLTWRSSSPAEARCSDGEQRAHALAAGADQVIGEFGDQRDRRAHTRQDLAIDPRHVVRAQRQQRIQAGTLALAFEGDDGGHV